MCVFGGSNMYTSWITTEVKDNLVRSDVITNRPKSILFTLEVVV